jgi:anti-sigma factor RsiW
MDHENYYTLMMDALDGELSAEGEAALQVHLRACPACQKEWQAVTAVDRLFRQTPMLSPAAGFTQRTIARLPSRRVRLWAMGTVYVTLLLSGLIPVFFFVLAMVLLLPIVQQPAIIDSAIQLMSKGVQLGAVILGGLFGGIEQLFIEQPALVGWLLVMAGVVFLWSGVLSQLLNQPTQQQSQI